MVVIIGAIIVFCLFMGVILIISGCHDYNEAYWIGELKRNKEETPDGKPKLYTGDINELIKKFQK